MASQAASKSLSVFNQIRAKILMSGPITVADYMKLALFQNASLSQSKVGGRGSAFTGFSESDASGSGRGYYMGKDVFGAGGDFTTSPEISQMFGEMVGLWGYQTWVRIGGPKKISIVEMGPGRGTMAKDVLRVFRTFVPPPNEISLHLVEISPFMANLQRETLCGSEKVAKEAAKRESKEKSAIDPTSNVENAPFYHLAVTPDTTVPVFWYRDLHSVPEGFHFYIAHEFFDVLPIHKLQKVQNAWREVLVDLDDKHEPEPPPAGNHAKPASPAKKLRYIISRNETPCIRVLENLYGAILKDAGNRSHLEVSLEAIQILEELCARLEVNGGLGLVVDYGHEGTKEDTFRGFLRHKVVDALEQPGLADLTADVDFSIVRKVCQEKALLLGTIPQADFLRRIGIGTRARALFRNCHSREEKQKLASAYKMLLTELGTKFFCLALLPKIMEEFRPKFKILAFDT